MDIDKELMKINPSFYSG